MNHRFETLKTEIFKHSREKSDWDRATLEWREIGLNLPGVPKAGRCLCTQEIEHKHVLKHRETGEEVVVGSVCIFRFMKANAKLIEEAKRAEYERVRRTCDRCAEWTVHPEYCKKCQNDMEKLETGWHECQSYACVNVLKEPGYCKKCAAYQHQEHLEQEALRKRVEHERRMEHLKQEQEEYKAQAVAKQQERIAKWQRVESMINMGKLTEIERKFVTESVQNCIMNDKKLSDKQRAWLQSIMLQKPARRN
jgi:hypothetical protein